jgi:hypothetical protein
VAVGVEEAKVIQKAGIARFASSFRDVDNKDSAL